MSHGELQISTASLQRPFSMWRFCPKIPNVWDAKLPPSGSLRLNSMVRLREGAHLYPVSTGTPIDPGSNAHHLSGSPPVTSSGSNLHGVAVRSTKTGMVLAVRVSCFSSIQAPSLNPSASRASRSGCLATKSSHAHRKRSWKFWAQC